MTTFAGAEIQTPAQLAGKTVGMVLWGPSGVGKSTFASTFPGKKLVLLYDHGGADILAGRDDIHVVPLHNLKPDHVERWKEFDPFGISKIIKELDIDTIIVDSLTTLSDTALRYGVDHASRTAQHARAGISVEDPGFGGYGRRKTWTMLAVHNLLRTAGANGCNIVFILHEDSPVTDSQGNTLHITMTLGSDMPEKTSLAVSEVWYMRDVGGGKPREILLRPAYMRKPMKTRMFDTRERYQFLWQYDPITHKGLTMEQLLDQWKANGYSKIPPPTGR